MPLKLQPCCTIEIRFIIITYWLYAGPSCTISQVLAIHRTMQVNSQPMEIIVYFWQQNCDMHGAWVMSLIGTNQTTYESNG